MSSAIVPPECILMRDKCVLLCHPDQVEPSSYIQYCAGLRKMILMAASTGEQVLSGVGVSQSWIYTYYYKYIYL